MNNVLGIIAEYNPFHNGHLYHLNESKKICDAETTVCVMSGNFTQRGTPAIIDKWTRAQMALENGVDIVIELPTIYSISSAEHFAYGSIKILDILGANYISFGSECGKINILDDIANVLYAEPKKYKTLLKHELSKGLSFPKAREHALLIYLNDIIKYANVLSNPNNILGIEYLKAIKKQENYIVPITIQRNSVNHDSPNANNGYANSSLIRKMICKGNEFKEYIPAKSYETINNCIKYGKMVYDLSTFEKEIIYAIRKMSLEEIANLPDVSEGLENRIKNAGDECNSVKELINMKVPTTSE